MSSNAEIYTGSVEWKIDIIKNNFWLGILKFTRKFGRCDKQKSIYLEKKTMRKACLASADMPCPMWTPARQKTK